MSLDITPALKGIQESVDAMEKDVRKTYVAGFARLVEKTPVDEGTLRSSWMIINEADMRNPLDKTIVIENRQPYAVTAEYGGWNGPTDKVNAQGFSRQAPKGMTRTTIMWMRAYLRRISK